MFGSNLCNDNLESIIMASDICNRLGLDTISAGACVAFTIECYENGILSAEDTGGLEIRWGDHQAIVALTEMIGRREGFGDLLADGVKVAAEKIGKGSEQYAMHIGGQEIAAHDPRGGWGFAIGYGADPTPGRHNQGGGQHPPGLDIPEVNDESPARPRALPQDQHQLHARGQRPWPVPLRHRRPTPDASQFVRSGQADHRLGVTSTPRN